MKEQSTIEKKFFMPKAQFKAVRDNIAKILEKEKTRSLSNQDKTKLKKLKSISRREFIKRGAAAAIGAGIVLAGGKKALDNVSEEKERVDPVNGVLAMIRDYNEWLENLETGEIEKVDGIQKFIEIYNQQIRYINTNPPLPEISLEEFLSSNSPEKFYSQIRPIRDTLRENGYYFYAAPVFGSWKNERIDFMAVIFGKVTTDTKSEISRRGQTKTYEHIVVDLPSSDANPNDYSSSPSAYTALTYEEAGKSIVMQYGVSYSVSAQRIYGALNSSTISEGDEARQVAFGQYNVPDKSQAIKSIKDQLMSTSLVHEQQHVLDGTGTFSTEGATESNLAKSMMIELRGLFAPLTVKNPKVGLQNIYNWIEGSDPIRREIGKLALSILKDISGKETRELLIATDSEMNELGEKAMDASDIFYQRIVKENKPADPSIQKEYESFLENLKRK